jgi:hypothetical protein
MTSVARNVGVALVAIASVIVVGAASPATATQACEVAKLKAAGKEVRAKMVCYARAKHAAAPVDSTCLTNAQTKADATINTADGACTGAAADIDAAVDSCVSAFLTDDPGTGACPARSAKAIGNGAKGELACQAKEVTTPGAFATCDTTEDSKTTARLGNAGGGTPCVNVTSVMADIDNCDTAIDALVPTTTTTTTTTLPPCGSSSPFSCGGSCPAGQTCQFVITGGAGVDCGTGCTCVPEDGVCTGCSLGPCIGVCEAFYAGSCGGVCQSGGCSSLP